MRCISGVTNRHSKRILFVSHLSHCLCLSRSCLSVREYCGHIKCNRRVSVLTNDCNIHRKTRPAVYLSVSKRKMHHCRGKCVSTLIVAFVEDELKHHYPIHDARDTQRETAVKELSSERRYTWFHMRERERGEEVTCER